MNNEINELDEKVIAMRFDNEQFEQGVNESISTIERLKKSTRLKDSAKGFEQLGKASDKLTFSKMRESLEAVRVQFKMTDVFAFNAMNRIANKAIDTGKKMVKGLTLDPVKDGFKEYELEMGAVQTIMAGTGESLATVSGYLNELNHYADKTIYSFSDMTQNIGKFTNAGVKLKDAVSAIQGIANEAAVSGANANEASRAMYNFAQALSAGYVKLIDWKSIENANMATKSFKQELIDTAVELGTVVKQGKDYVSVTTDANGKISQAFNSTKMFNDSLSAQWMTTDVLTKTLAKYSDETTDIGKKATAAATEVKTWTQLMDTLKEAAGSGWARTWKLIVGDFNEAKKTFTAISNVVGGFIDKMSDARNTLLEKVLSKGNWSAFEGQLAGTNISIKMLRRELIQTAKEHGVAVEKMIKKNGSFTKSLKEGWATPEIFNETMTKIAKGENKMLDVSKKLQENMNGLDKLARQVIAGNLGKTAKEIKANIVSTGYSYNSVMKAVKEINEKGKLSFKGITDEEGNMIQLTGANRQAMLDFAKAAKDSDTVLNMFINDLSSDRMSGRELIVDSIKNIFTRLKTDIYAVKAAWDMTFEKIDPNRIYKVLTKFNEWTKSLLEMDGAKERIAEVIRVFHGLFTAIDLVRKGALILAKDALMLLKFALDKLDIDVLQLAANLGDLLVMFHDWVLSGKALKTALLLGKLGALALLEAIGRLIAFVQKIPGANKVFTALGKVIGGAAKVAYSAVKTVIDIFKKAKSPAEAATLTIRKASMGLTDLGTVIKRIPVVGPIFDKAGKSIKTFAGYVKSNATSALVKFLNTCKKSGPIKALGELFSGAAKGAKHLFEKLIAAGSKLPSIGGVIQDVGGLIIAVWEKVQNGLSKLVANFKDLEIGSNIMTVMGDTTKTVGERIKTIIVDMATEIGKRVKKLPSIGTAIKTLEKTIKAFSKNLTAFFKGDKKIIDTFRDAINDLNNVTLEGLKRTLIEAGQWAKSSLSNVFKTIFGSKKKMTVANEEMKMSAASMGVPSGVLEGLHKFFEEVKKFTGDLSLGNIAALAFAGALIKMAFGLQELANKTINLLSPLKAIGEATAKIGTAVANMFTTLSTSITNLSNAAVGLIKAKRLEVMSGVMMKFAESLAIMTVSLMALSQVPMDKMKNGLIAMGVICAEVAAVTFALSKVGTNLADVGKVTGLLIGMAAATLLLVHAMKKFEKISIPGVIKGLAGVGGILTMYAGLIIGVGKMGAKVEVGIAQIIAIAWSTMLMAKTLKKLAELPFTGILKGIIGLNACTLALMGLIAVISKCALAAGTTIVGVGTLIGISVSLLMMANVLKKLATVKWNTIKASFVPMIAAMGMLSVMLAATRLAGKFAKGSGVAVAGLSVSLLLLISVIKHAANLKPSTLDKAKTNLNTLIGLTAVMLLLTRLGGDHALSGAAGVIVLSGAMMVLAGVAVVLGSLDPKRVMIGVAAIDGIALGLAAILAASHLASQCKIAVMAITTAVTIMAAAIAVLALLKPEPVWTAAKAMSAVMGMFALIELGASKARNSNAVVLEMAVVIGAIGGMIYLIGQLPVQNAIAGAGALSAVMLTACVMFVSIAHYQQDIVDALKSVGVMSLAMAALTGIVALLSMIKHTDRAIEGAKAMLILTGVCTAIGVALGVFGTLLNPGVILSGLASFGLILGVFGAVFLAFGAINTLIPKAEEFLDKGINVLVKIGEGIGKVFASLVTGAMKEVGEGFSDFWLNAKPFFEGMNGLSPNVLIGVKALAETIKTICGGSILNYLKNLLTAKSSMSNFGKAITPLGKAVVEFDKVTTGINPDTTRAAAESIKYIAQAAKIVQESGDLKNLDSFREQMGWFGEAVRDYSQDAEQVNVEAVENSKSAAMAIIEIAKAIPNSGGLLGKLVGENDMDDFALGMKAFGNALVDYSAAITAGSGINNEAIANSVEGARYIVEVAKEIPNSGGFIEKVVGNNDLGPFGKQMASFGKSIVAYSNSITANGGINTGAIEDSAVATKAFVKIAQEIPNTAGLFNSKTDLKDFGDQMEWLAISLKSLSDKLLADGGIDFGTVDLAIGMVRRLTDLSGSVAGMGKTYNTFATTLVKLGNGFSEFGSKMEELDMFKIDHVCIYIRAIATASQSIDPQAIANLVKMADAIGKLGKSTFGKFADSINESSKTVMSNVQKMMDGMVTKIKSYHTKLTGAFSEATSGVNTVVKQMKKSGNNAAANFASGLLAQKSKAKSNGGKLAAAAVAGTRTKYKDAEKAGNYIATGFANGVKSKRSAAIGKNAMLGFCHTTYNQFTDFWDIHSPSRLAAILGEFITKGVAKGIKGGKNNANSACNTFCKTLHDVFSVDLTKTTNKLKQQASAQGQGIIDALLAPFNKKKGKKKDSKVNNATRQLQDELEKELNINNGALKADPVPSYSGGGGIGSSSGTKKGRSGGSGSGKNKKKKEKPIKFKAVDLGKGEIKNWEYWVEHIKNTYVSTAHAIAEIDKKAGLSHKELGKVIKEVTGGITKNVEVSDKQISKISKSMEVGQKAFVQYVNMFGEKNDAGGFVNFKKTATEASDAMYTYAYSLYKVSDAYKEDMKQMKADKKVLDKAYKDRNKIVKNYNKKQKKLLQEMAEYEAKFKKAKNNEERKKWQDKYNEAASQYKANRKEFKKNLDASTDDINAAKKKIIKNAQESEKHVKEAFYNMRNAIKDAWETWLKVPTVKIDLGFSDVFGTPDSTFEDKVKSAEEAVQSYKDTIVELGKSIEELDADYLEKSAELQDELYEAEHMKYENTEKRKKIAEAQKKIEQAELEYAKKKAEYEEKITQAKEAQLKAEEEQAKLDTFTDEQSNFDLKAQAQTVWNQTQRELMQLLQNGLIPKSMYDEIVAKGPSEGKKLAEQYMDGIREGIINGAGNVMTESALSLDNLFTGQALKKVKTDKFAEDLKTLYGDNKTAGKLAEALGGTETKAYRLAIEELRRVNEKEGPETAQEMISVLANASDAQLKQWADNLDVDPLAAEIADKFLAADAKSNMEIVGETKENLKNEITTMAEEIITEVNEKVMKPVIKELPKTVKKGTKKASQTYVTEASKHIGGEEAQNKLKTAGKTGGKAAVSGFKTKVNETAGANATKSFMQGAINGINAKKTALTNTATKAGNEVKSAINAKCTEIISVVQNAVDRIVVLAQEAQRQLVIALEAKAQAEAALAAAYSASAAASGGGGSKGNSGSTSSSKTSTSKAISTQNAVRTQQVSTTTVNKTTNYTTNNYSFNQTNNSPRSLNRAEIKRQTASQLSLAKERIGLT